MKLLLIWMLFCCNLLVTSVYSKPTVYKKNENDKLEPGKQVFLLCETYKVPINLCTIKCYINHQTE